MQTKKYNEGIVKILVRFFASAFYQAEAIVVSATKEK
jgi:hypothetical protein